MSDQPLSEQYRLIGDEWVDKDATARLREETKSAFLSRLMLAQGQMPVSKAEMLARASPAWAEWIEAMVHDRTEANRLKVRLKSIDMRHSERIDMGATARAERRL